MSKIEKVQQLFNRERKTVDIDEVTTDNAQSLHIRREPDNWQIRFVIRGIRTSVIFQKVTELESDEVESNTWTVNWKASGDSRRGISSDAVNSIISGVMFAIGHFASKNRQAVLVYQTTVRGKTTYQAIQVKPRWKIDV